MSFAILAIGCVLCVEGLVLALAPSRLEDLILFLARISFNTRRRIGLFALALGIVLVWLGRGQLGL